MRKGLRFTPARLEKWRDEGRGTGTGSDYQPWHQVTRSDPGSRGRSHLINWRFGRLHHLLSDQEMVAFAFASMLPNLVDLREQYPLAHEVGEPEIAAYQSSANVLAAQGTLQISEDLGHKHPVVRKDGVVALWVMTTDLVLTLKNPAGRCKLLAISVKLDSELSNPRTIELLRIEREYWLRQDVFWLLLSPSLYSDSVANTIRIGMPWAVDVSPVSSEILDALAVTLPSPGGMTLSSIIAHVTQVLPVAKAKALYVFWQAVWTGRVPLDMSRSMRPNEPISLLSPAEFWRQNPIVSRRTAWRN